MVGFFGDVFGLQGFKGNSLQFIVLFIQVPGAFSDFAFQTLTVTGQLAVTLLYLVKHLIKYIDQGAVFVIADLICTDMVFFSVETDFIVTINSVNGVVNTFCKRVEISTTIKKDSRAIVITSR